MTEKSDQESATDRDPRSKGQEPPSPENSASIHRHPKMMCGLQEGMSRIKQQLVCDHTKGILAVEEVLVLLQDRGLDPFPGFAQNMTEEFAGIREELGELDPNRPSNAQRFVTVAKRIDFLLRTLSVVVGCSLDKVKTIPSAAPRRARDTKPELTSAQAEQSDAKL